MKDKSLHKHQSTALIVGGEHSQFKKAMKDYICNNDKNKPIVIVNQYADKIENVDYVEHLEI